MFHLIVGNVSCPRLSNYTEVSGMYFKLVDNTEGSDSAREDCKKDGAELPIIKSEADLAVASFLAGN